MTIKQLHEITGSLIAKHGNDPVAINSATFAENENGDIIECDTAGIERVQGADDSGPVGRRYPMLVINGPA